jgi:thiol-disulfide isomerase/thioredoxin
MSDHPNVPGPLRSKPGLLTLAVVAVVTIGLVIAAQSEAEPGDGGQETVGDFRFELFDGTTFSLAEHFADDGRPVVLNFWASWCPPCRAEMPDFDAVAGRHPEVKFIGVAVDDVESQARAFAEEIGVSYTLGFDPTGQAHLTLPFIALPTTWIITGDGVIVHKVQGIMTAELLEQALADKL